MTPEQLRNTDLDRLMRNVLISNNDLMIPPGLSDKAIRKLEKKILLRELLLELSFKIGLVLCSLGILAGVFVWTNGSGMLTNLVTQFVNNWQIITSLLLLVFFTMLIDQVALRFFNTFKKEASL